jgi:hypothetical protein
MRRLRYERDKENEEKCEGIILTITIRRKKG